jgi:hypothetical protein
MFMETACPPLMTSCGVPIITVFAVFVLSFCVAALEDADIRELDFLLLANKYTQLS